MNLLGGKIINFLGVDVSVAIFMAPITFLVTDVVEEVYGKEKVKEFLFSTLITLFVVFGFTIVFAKLNPADRFLFDAEYKTIFLSSARFILASIVAFLFGQLNDMAVFAFLKKKSAGKHLWIRNNLSTMISQAVDTLLFMFIAFYHLAPKFTAAYVISLAIPYYLFK
ncbi:MAG: queuosine precursor transporter, partial [Candidatus Gracilibacteria bacterium]|nr:queuosine precursor transporter [Candidatus Gracilibacteria bacterium]